MYIEITSFNRERAKKLTDDYMADPQVKWAQRNRPETNFSNGATDRVRIYQSYIGEIAFDKYLCLKDKSYTWILDKITRKKRSNFIINCEGKEVVANVITTHHNVHNLLIDHEAFEQNPQVDYYILLGINSNNPENESSIIEVTGLGIVHRENLLGSKDWIEKYKRDMYCMPVNDLRDLEDFIDLWIGDAQEETEESDLDKTFKEVTTPQAHSLNLLGKPSVPVTKIKYLSTKTVESILLTRISTTVPTIEKLSFHIPAVNSPLKNLKVGDIVRIMSEVFVVAKVPKLSEFAVEAECKRAIAGSTPCTHFEGTPVGIELLEEVEELVS